MVDGFLFSVWNACQTNPIADVKPAEVDLGMFGQTGGLTKREPPQARMLDSSATFSGVSLWHVNLIALMMMMMMTTFRSSLGVSQDPLVWGCWGGALYAVLRNLNFSSLITDLFPEQKIYVRAPTFLPNRA